LSTYRLPTPYDRQPLRRRVSGFLLALGINLGLLLILMTLGIIPPPATEKRMRGIVVTLVPESHGAAPTKAAKAKASLPRLVQQEPLPKPPPIVLPAKPTIAVPQTSPQRTPWLEMSKDEMAASDISKMPVASSGDRGDSEVVGKGPNGEALYAAEWAREPTDAELAGYLPRSAPEGFGLVACKTIENDRVEDCIELGQTPGSRLASAVRQAAWQFRVRPPRKGGRPLIGSWVRIRIDYYRSGTSSGD
jgi:protein TonB